MASAPSLPSYLNLIFHGPWGFLVNHPSGMITAVTPDCSDHTYAMGDTPVLESMPAGAYSFADPTCVAGQPAGNGTTQTNVLFSDTTAVNLAPLRYFQLPLTALQPGLSFLRSPAVASGDNLLSGGSFGKLNTSGNTPVVLAANQVLPYTINAGRMPTLSGPSGVTWSPAQYFNQGRTSINLHVFAQEMVPVPAPAVPGQDFSAMAKLFGLSLTLAPPTQAGSSSNLPTGVSQDDLGDLGKIGMNTDHLFTYKIPLLCGGNLIVA